MLQNIDELNFIVGNKIQLKKISKTKCKRIFDDEILEFLGELSVLLLRDKETRKYPDIAAFAFWIRKSSMKKESMNYSLSNRVGRGIVFHIAPSNIPIQFAVSLVYALLSGNASIIRISDKEYEQVDIVCKYINQLLERKYKSIREYIIIVRYGHDESVNRYFSEICDARIVWGGDETINIFGGISLSSRSVELKFADRFSIAIIDSDKYLDMDKKEIAEKFYFDTYWVDQNACSSPRLVLWTGNSKTQAKKIFWYELKKIVDDKYDFKPISGCEKLLKFVEYASVNNNIRMEKYDNSLIIVKVDNISDIMMKYKGNCGYFFEADMKDLIQLVNISSKKCQTISCCGIEKEIIYDILIENGVKGVDRIVEFGHCLDLSLHWDGYSMIDELSRFIDL